MTPYADDDDDDGESAFPTVELDGRYDDLSDDDMDDVYADFEILFRQKSESPEVPGGGGGGGGGATINHQEGSSDHYYEEYLDELDGLPWVS
jgi:hypothetical protein